MELVFRVSDHHCNIKMSQHDGAGFEEAVENLIGQRQPLHIANGAGSLYPVVHDGQSQLCLANMCPAGPLDFSSIVPDRGIKCLGRRGLVARLSILTYSWYSAAFTHMPRFREQPSARPSDPGSPLPSFVQTAVQFISLNVLFHQTPAPSQRPPPLPGSYREPRL